MLSAWLTAAMTKIGPETRKGLGLGIKAVAFAIVTILPPLALDVREIKAQVAALAAEHNRVDSANASAYESQTLALQSLQSQLQAALNELVEARKESALLREALRDGVDVKTRKVRR